MDQTQGKIPVAIVGTGGMAATMVRAMASSPWFKPVAVLSGNKDRAQAFATHFGLPQSYDNLPMLLRDSGCKALYIANANTQHVATATAAISAGVPVLIEKPLATTAHETEGLFDLATRNGVVLFENYWVLALPAYRRLKAELGDRDTQMSLQFDFSMPVTAAQMPGLFDPNGGGVLLDRAVYGLAYAYDLLGPVRDMKVHLRRDAAGIDLGASLLLVHETGSTSTITIALDVAGPNDLTVSNATTSWHLSPGLGAEYLTATHFGSYPAKADGWSSEGRAAKLKRLPFLRRAKNLLRMRATRAVGYGANMYHPVLQAFHDSLSAPNTASPCVPPELSIAVSQLIEQARSA